MRGRLIFPVKLSIAQLDTVATEANDPDGAGAKTSGYDDDFLEPEMIAPSDGASGAPRGTFTTTYKTPILIPAQFEDESFEEVQEMISGSSPNYKFTAVMHFKNLEDSSLVRDDGRPVINTEDKFMGIYHYMTEELIELAPSDRDIVVTEVKPASYGLSSFKRNLLIVTFEDREKSSPSF